MLLGLPNHISTRKPESMTQEPAKKSRKFVELSVLRTRWLTPHMIRVVLGGQGISDFHDNNDSDHYVKLLFPPTGVSYPEPFDLETIERDFPRDQRPVRRTYTVRHFDTTAGELTIDFVYHGDEGIAGPWAATALPGDKLRLLGPGGAYAPSPDADWHLLVGDEAALPAIASALEWLEVGAKAQVIVQVDSAAEIQQIDTKADVEFTWLFRDTAQNANPRQDLVDAVTSLAFPAGQGHIFVHGEAEMVMKQLRPHLLNDRNVNRDWLSISGYWRSGNTEESFREWKSAQKKALAS